MTQTSNMALFNFFIVHLCVSIFYEYLDKIIHKIEHKFNMTFILFLNCTLSPGQVNEKAVLLASIFCFTDFMQ